MSDLQIVELLGGRKILGKSGSLETLAKQGLPKQALIFFLQTSLMDEGRLFSYLDVTKRALENYKSTERMRLYISDRLIHLAELFAKGKEIFGDLDNFSEWLNKPSIDLDGAIPVERVQTRKGIDDLLHVLGRLEHGVLA